MGLLDWLLRPFRKSAPAEEPAAGAAMDEADFFGDKPTAPKPAPKAAAPAPKPAPKAAAPAPKPAPKVAKPKAPAQSTTRSKKPERPAKPAPPAPAPAAEVMSVEEAERRYGALVQPPAPKPPAPKKVKPKPPPAPDAAALPSEAPPPPPALGPSADELRAEEEAARAQAEADARAAAEARRAEANENRRLAQLPRYRALLSRADALLAVPEVDPRHLLSAKRSLLEDWKALGAPPESEKEALRAALAERLDAFSARGKAGFEAMDGERQQNLAKKREILAELESLAASEDLRELGPKIGALQARWREVGPVPKEELEPLRAAFEAARARALSRRQEARERQDAERAEQLASLERLVAQAESLASARDPQAAAERVKALQAQWKSVRPRGAREQVDQLWARFRAACDTVFERRNAARDAEIQANLARKQALVDRATALADGEPSEDPDAIIRKLMGEWRKVGMVPREAGDALWASFKAACDRLREPPRVELPGGEDRGALQHQPFAALGRKDG